MCIGGEEWRVSAVCTYCGGPLAAVNGCRPSSTLAVSVVRCEPCGREFDLTARLTERRRSTRYQRRKAAA